MKNTLRLFCCLLGLLLLFPLAAACAGNGDDPAAVTTADADTPTGEGTASDKDENGYLLDSLGDDLDFGKAVISVLYWDDVENQEYFAEEITTELVNDAIFNRNEKVCSRLNIEFDFIPTPGDSGNAPKYTQFVQNAISGGTKYDIISAHSRSIGLCAYNGLTQDLIPLDYLDLTKPWWQKSLLTTAKINGQLHFVSGDISTNMLYMMYVTFYNKDMIAANGIDDPYECVVSNTWTIDRMIEMGSDLYADLDHDGKKSAGDQYGQSCKVLHADAYLWGSGILGLTTTADGKLILDDSFKGERCMDVIDKFYKYFQVSDDGILYEDGSDYKNIFRDGHSLFITDRADIAINDLNDKAFAEMGIVPIPKYNSDQTEFRTIIGNPFSLYAIPTNAADPDRSAAVLECLASESYRGVTPAIFEITMKSRYSSDSRDAQMYDIARAGAVYDLSRIFWKVFSTAACDAPDTRFENALFSGSGSWATNIKNSDRLVTRILQAIDDVFSK